MELRKELIPFLLDCKERAPSNYFGGSYKGSLAQKIAKNVWSVLKYQDSCFTKGSIPSHADLGECLSS